VRTLLATGFPAAEEDRTGNRGAKEIPYRATGLSWRSRIPNAAPVLVETFLQEIDGLTPSEIDVWRLGLRLNETNRSEMMRRIREILEEYAVRDSDPDGTATSIMLAHHLDRSAD